MTRTASDRRRPFGRLLTAMVTPFRADGSLDPDGAARLATHLVDEQGNDAVVINGTTGEAPTTSDAEKDTALLPVMLYDIPHRAGVAIATDTLCRLAEHERIVAVKDAKSDLIATSWVTKRTDLAIYSGDDALTVGVLAVGGVGLVGTSTHLTGA